MWQQKQIDYLLYALFNSGYNKKQMFLISNSSLIYYEFHTQNKQFHSNLSNLILIFDTKLTKFYQSTKLLVLIWSSNVFIFWFYHVIFGSWGRDGELSQKESLGASQIIPERTSEILPKFITNIFIFLNKISIYRY